MAHVRWFVAAATLFVGVQFAQAQSEMEVVQRYCQGMTISYPFPDGTTADCLSDTHIIEVKRTTDAWLKAFAQSLHYALWTRDIAESPEGQPENWQRRIEKLGKPKITNPRKAGIILVCQMQAETCTEHFSNLYRLIDENAVPITVWDCDWESAMAVSDCPSRDWSSPKQAGLRFLLALRSTALALTNVPPFGLLFASLWRST